MSKGKEMNQEFYIAGVSAVDLAEKYGTPLYVYDIGDIKEKIQELRECFSDKYDRTIISYAAKAFASIQIFQLMKEEGLHLDLVSGGELAMALHAGFPAEDIELNGNNKSYEELDLAIRNDIGKIIVDGSNEIPMIRDLAEKYDKKVSLLFRVSPGLDADTHAYISTGMVDSKFGFQVSQVLDQVKKVESSDRLEFLGYHFHLGSQLFQNDIYLNALDIMFELIDKTHEETQLEVKELNIGGGFGIEYTDQDQRKPFSYFLDPIMEKILAFYAEKDQKRPIISIEPGRSLVGEAGYTLYRVGSIKDIEGIRKYVAVDGGMTDNIRPALYGAEYDAILANKYKQPVEEEVRICGKCCESGDILIKNIALPKVEVGDLVCVRSTGAYGYSMSSNYNSLLKPAIVFVEDAKDWLAVKRQTYEDLWALDIQN